MKQLLEKTYFKALNAPSPVSKAWPRLWTHPWFLAFFVALGSAAFAVAWGVCAGHFFK